MWAGIPADMAKVINEENETYLDKITMSTESGMVAASLRSAPTRRCL